ncbi:putative F-box domain-containing protein [Helianthus annuus]|nr:putative F-box domain-containing protein [Helianthus annuus]KAJ0834173.1 putative F-box domain-containing protein [Helianthus annuus]
MKLRLRSVETKETLKIETPNPCSLQQLRELVSQKLPSASTLSTIHFSLNRKDQLTTESAEESIQSIGITSGDLVYFTTNPNGFSTAPVSRQSQNPQTVIPASSKQDETLNTVASEKVRQSQNPQTVIPASSKQDETLNTVASEKVDSGDNSNAEEIAEYMEIEDGESSAINEVGKSFSVPGFLRKVFTEELRDSDGLNRKLLRVAVHAVLLESGFVEIDPVSNMLKDGNNFGVKDNWYLASVHYTLPEIIVPGGNVETVKIKFQNLGKYCKVYGSLVNGTMVHSVLIDEDKLVPFLNVVWANCGAVVATMAENNEIANVEPEKHVFEFWRKIKDGISLPLLIDLCEKAGLQVPPCFMQLPTELKLKILESLSGVEIAKVSCVCSELRYLASSDDLWKQKYIEQFGNVAGLNSGTGFKTRFANSWEANKRRKIAGRSAASIMGRRRHPFAPSGMGFPRIIGGDYDLFPNLGPRGLVGLPQGRGPRLRNVIPDCNLGGFAGSNGL